MSEDMAVESAAADVPVAGNSLYSGASAGMDAGDLIEAARDDAPAAKESGQGKETGDKAAKDKDADKSQAAAKEKDADKSQAAAKEKDADKSDKAAAKDEKADAENQPISDWSKVDLGLPEDANVDATLLDSFGAQAKELGLTPKQAKALVNWNLDMEGKAREALLDAGTKQLAKEWGSKADEYQRQAEEALTMLDRMTEGEFGKAVGQSGAACHQGFIKGLLAISRAISEDTLGRMNASAMPQHEETVLEGLEAAWREARGR